MKSILVTVCMLPFLPVVMLIVALLSIMPRESRPRRFRDWILDELDRLTNDYGAQLIYLEQPRHQPNFERIDNGELRPASKRKYRNLVLVKGYRR